MLQIFHKPNKLVGIVKCTDCVVIKWESDDQTNGLSVIGGLEWTTGMDYWNGL